MTQKASVRWIVLLLCLLSLQTQLLAYNAVSYSFSGGRFGDQLISCLHARWYAYENKIPFLYYPFAYSSELALSQNELKLEGADFAASDIFYCPYFPESKWDLEKDPYYHFPVDWKNPEFRSLVKAMIAPLNELHLVSVPKNCINVALHYREGGGFDLPIAFQVCPWKFPPLSYYIKCLKKTLKHFNGKPVFCYVFTDALNPAAVIKQIQDALPEEAQVTFGFRSDSPGPNTNVLEDFFSLFLFDVLIRPESNFSIVPSRIHDYAIIYSPKHISIDREVVTVDRVHIEMNEDQCKKVLARTENIEAFSN